VQTKVSASSGEKLSQKGAGRAVLERDE
jgi:hypothetical protein